MRMRGRRGSKYKVCVYHFLNQMIIVGA